MIPITYGNILAVFFNATDLETINGAKWYRTANNAALIMAERYSVSLEIAAGMIAALSPNNRWERNLTDADSMIRAYSIGGHNAADSTKVGTYNANKIKALAILSGDDCLQILGGLKVRAFYDCIIGGDSVCIDGHAYAIWKGERIPTSQTPKITPKIYDSIVADYRQAARVINLILQADYSAAQIQAITWIAWRRMVKEGQS
jgi:hypothetical protein